MIRGVWFNLVLALFLLEITLVLQEDANVKARCCHRQKGMNWSGRTEGSFFPSVQVQVHLQQIVATGWTAGAKDALTPCPEAQLAGYYRVAIFSAATKWTWSFSCLNYWGYSEASRSLKRLILNNRYLGHMYNIYQDGIKWWPGIITNWEMMLNFWAAYFRKIVWMSPYMHWVQSKIANSCRFSSLWSLLKTTCTEHPGDFLHEVEGATHQHFKCCIHTMAHRNPAGSRLCWHLAFSSSRPSDGKALSVVNQKGKRF